MTHLVWQQWTLLVVYAWGALATVGSIGKPRKPLSPGVAVVALIIGIAQAILLVTVTA